MKRHAPTREEIRQAAREFRAQIYRAAQEMKVKTPRHYYAPGPGKMLTAGQYLRACKLVIECHEAQEFKMSFQCWWPQTADEIRSQEIRPAIHERINARGLMEARERRRFEEMVEHSE